MGPFDYLVALLSFVYALALTHLLTSVTELIRARDRVRFSWVHALWMADALLLLFLNWLQQYANRSIHRWDVFNVAMTFVFAVVQYFASSFVSPPVPEHGEIDLEDFHDRQKLTYLAAFLCLAILAPISTWYEWNLTRQVSPHDFLVRQAPALLGIGLVALAMVAKGRRLELACAAVVLMLLASLGFANTEDLM